MDFHLCVSLASEPLYLESIVVTLEIDAGPIGQSWFFRPILREIPCGARLEEFGDAKAGLRKPS